MKWSALALLLIAPGLAIMVGCGYYLLVDWGALQTSYQHLENLVAQNADLRQLFIADAQQDAHRTNMFAEGVWFLLAALLAGLGVHGLCVMPRRAKSGAEARAGSSDQ